MSASEKDDLTFLATLFFLLVLYAIYNAQAEKEVQKVPERSESVMTVAVPGKQMLAVL